MNKFFSDIENKENISLNLKKKLNLKFNKFTLESDSKDIDSLLFNTNDAGGIDINCGSEGIDINSKGRISFQCGDDGMDIMTTGNIDIDTGEDGLNIDTKGDLNFVSGDNLSLISNRHFNIKSNSNIEILSGGSSDNSILLSAIHEDGGIELKCNGLLKLYSKNDGIDLKTESDININAGEGGININSIDNIVLKAEESLNLKSITGNINVNCLNNIHLNSSSSRCDAILLKTNNIDGGIELNSKNIDLDADEGNIKIHANDIEIDGFINSNLISEKKSNLGSNKFKWGDLYINNIYCSNLNKEIEDLKKKYNNLNNLVNQLLFIVNNDNISTNIDGPQFL